MPVLFDMQDRPYGYGVRDDYGLPRLEHALQGCPDTIFIGHGQPFGQKYQQMYLPTIVQAIRKVLLNPVVLFPIDEKVPKSMGGYFSRKWL